jgi:SulP family sulfate permease
MSGIGLILIILQLAPMLGHAAPPGGVLGALEALPRLLAQLRPEELALAGLSLAILFFMPANARRYMPPQLLALVLGTLLSVFLLADADIRRIGEIPGGLPDLQLPVFTAAQ